MNYKEFSYQYNDILINENINKCSFYELSCELLDVFSKKIIKPNEIANLNFHIYNSWIQNKTHSFLSKILLVSENMLKNKKDLEKLNSLFLELKNEILKFYSNK